jgi:hypothetical protein
MFRGPAWIVMLSGVLAVSAASAADDANSAPTAARADADMMKRYLLRQSEQATRQWEADYEARTSAEQIAAHQKTSREQMIASLGGLPERTPLNARTTGTLRREGYTVEKVLFESLPQVHVTGLLFVPDPARFKPPHPGVVVPCGHSLDGKAYASYQAMGALLALNGMAALVFDPLDLAERLQIRAERPGHVQEGGKWHLLAGVSAHEMFGIGSILLGRNTARIMIWDTIRAIDYLQSRQDIDGRRIGLTGNSGGGIQTAQVVALDPRVAAAAPSCYINNLFELLNTAGARDAEHHIWAEATLGPRPDDLLMLGAPTPTLLCAATRDYFPISGTWQTARRVKRVYTRLGFAERFDVIEDDVPHSYSRTLREGAARWMSRWLLHKDQPITEPAIQLLTNEEARCTPDGHVLNLPGERSVYDLNQDYENELATRREAAWANEGRTRRLERVREIAGIRPLVQIPLPRVAPRETVMRAGYRVQMFDFHPEEGIVLPAALFVPTTAPSGRVVLYLHERGIATVAVPGGPIEQLVAGGARVLAVEPRGTGQSQQTQQNNFGPRIGLDWRDVTTAYSLGRSFVGMRAEDVLVAARHALQHLEGGAVSAVELVAAGNIGVPALHAAALEPSLFSSVKLSHMLVSWANVIECQATYNQYINVVHGALLDYDLPNLAAALGDRLTLEHALDALGKPFAPK